MKLFFVFPGVLFSLPHIVEIKKINLIVRIVQMLRLYWTLVVVLAEGLNVLSSPPGDLDNEQRSTQEQDNNFPVIDVQIADMDDFSEYHDSAYTRLESNPVHYNSSLVVFQSVILPINPQQIPTLANLPKAPQVKLFQFQGF